MPARHKLWLIQSLKILLLTLPLIVGAQTTTPADQIPHTETIQEKITRYAEQYHVSRVTMDTIVKRETAGTYDPTIQSTVRYNFSDPKRGIVKGQQEKSYGLSQIHIPDHQGITIAQAEDPDFALNFLAENLSKGRCWMWTTCPL